MTWLCSVQDMETLDAANGGVILIATPGRLHGQITTTSGG